MFLAYIGFSRDISDIFSHRGDVNSFRVFASKPTVDDIVKVYQLVYPDNNDYRIFANALHHMVNTGVGYYYGKHFYLKEIMGN